MTTQRQWIPRIKEKTNKRLSISVSMKVVGGFWISNKDGQIGEVYPIISSSVFLVMIIASQVIEREFDYLRWLQAKDTLAMSSKQISARYCCLFFKTSKMSLEIQPFWIFSIFWTLFKGNCCGVAIAPTAGCRDDR